MKKISAVCLAVLFVSALCFAQEPKVNPVSTGSTSNVNQNVGKWSKAVSGLRCRIETEKMVYKVGEKISISFSWQNVSDKKIMLYYSDDDLIYRLLSVRRQDGSMPLGRLIMIKNPSRHILSLEPGDTYTFKLNGTLSKEYMKEPWLKEHQRKAGNIVLKFEGKLFKEFPILLDKPGNYFLSFIYFLPADSFLAKKEPFMWSGEISSEEIMIKVAGGK